MVAYALHETGLSEHFRLRFRLPLTVYGRRELALWGGLCLAAFVVCAGLGPWLRQPGLSIASLVPLAGLAFFLNFFRDPERTPPEGPATLVSPADGRVTDILEVDEPEYVGGRAVRVGIFMSPFDVHVNRYPVDGRVEHASHRPGLFLAAYDARAPLENEARSLGIAARLPDREFRVLVRQISGVAARRIVCPVQPGAEARRGERFGMIKLGSRCELYLPRELGAEIAVRVGDRVRAGETPLARVPSPPRAPSRRERGVENVEVRSK